MPESLHISLIHKVDLINAEAATGVFCKKWYSSKFSKFHRETPVLEHGTMRNHFLIKLQQTRSATLLKLNSNTDVFL